MLVPFYLTYSMEQSPSWEADQFSQLTKKFPAFYGTRRFFNVLTSARHLSLSWANSIQSPRPPSHFLNIHLNIILPSTSVSPQRPLSPQVSPPTPCAHHSPLPHAPHDPPISFFFLFWQGISVVLRSNKRNNNKHSLTQLSVTVISYNLQNHISSLKSHHQAEYKSICNTMP
jgi:hypothetical protein